MKHADLTLINTLEQKDIPWQFLSTPYGRGDDFPQWFEQLAGEDQEQAESARKQLWMHTEHQSTLWQVTPFAMILLRRMLADAVQAKNQGLIGRVLDIYIPIFEAASGSMEMDRPMPLAFFSDLLREENLLPEASVLEDGEEDDEDAILEEYYSNLPEEVFYSFFHYSWMVLGLSLEEMGETLRNMEDLEIAERLEKLSDFETIRFLQFIIYPS